MTTNMQNFDQAIKALKTLLQADDVQLMPAQERAGYYLHVSLFVPWSRMSGEQKFAEYFPELWDKTAQLISYPRQKELEAELRGTREMIDKQKQEIADLQRYKTAFELR